MIVNRMAQMAVGLALIAGSAFAQQPPMGGRRGPGREAGGEQIVEKAPLAKSDLETRILGVLDEMDRSQRRGSMSVPREDGRLLRLLAESMGAQKVVEVGTSIGYSGLWICLGLQGTGGHLTTFEIDSGRAAQARANFAKAGVEGAVSLVEGDAHQEVPKLTGPIDMVFLDADKEGYLDYLEKLLPLVRPGGLIVAHNMNPRQADPRYVEAITTNPQLDTIFLNKGEGGVGVTLKKR